MIAPHILVLSGFLSVTWGIYLAFTIVDYRHERTLSAYRRRGAVIGAFRRMVVAFSLWMICVGLLFRTGMVLLGFGDAVAAQVTFFAIVGTNVVGSLYAVVSLRFD